jgi:hypothetical protein
MKTKTVIEIDYNEFEDIVRKTYGLAERDSNAYSFVATEECGNDSTHEFVVDKIEKLDEWEIESIHKLIAGKCPTYCNDTIFQDLVNQGILQPGTYIVNVCW